MLSLRRITVRRAMWTPALALHKMHRSPKTFTAAEQVGDGVTLGFRTIAHHDQPSVLITGTRLAHFDLNAVAQRFDLLG